MARRKVDVEIRTKANVSGLDKFGRSVRTTVKKMKDSFGEGNLAITDVVSSLSLATIGLKNVWGWVSKVGKAMLTMAKRGSSVLGVQAAFNRVTRDSVAALEEMRAATVGLISDFDLMKSFNRAVALGAANNSTEFSRMAKTAIALGTALDVGATSALESLTLGIGRQSKLILDNLGIIVSAKKAYADYAKELGVTASSLSDLEKRQAFTNAALDAADATVAKMGVGTENLGLSIDRVARAWTNFTDKIAIAIAKNPILIKQLEGIAGLLDRLAPDGIDLGARGIEGIAELTREDALARRARETSKLTRLQNEAIIGARGAGITSTDPATIEAALRERLEGLQAERRGMSSIQQGTSRAEELRAQIDNTKALLRAAEKAAISSNIMQALNDRIAELTLVEEDRLASDVEKAKAPKLRVGIRGPEVGRVGDELGGLAAAGVTIGEPGAPGALRPPGMPGQTAMQTAANVAALVYMEGGRQSARVFLEGFLDEAETSEALEMARQRAMELEAEALKKGGLDMADLWSDLLAQMVSAAAGGGDILVAVFASIMSRLAQEIQKLMTAQGGILATLAGPLGAVIGIGAAALTQRSRAGGGGPIPVAVTNRVRLDRDSEVDPVIVVQITDPNSDRVMERFIVESERLSARGTAPRIPRPAFRGGL